ncbi:hypothetical protein [Streptacidiphilus sp. EB129]|uniref:hypothetical protein n=1 Tax=Streptacidiphilus sp. EB129 TaxID=3156262 RepID=UPI003511116A
MRRTFLGLATVGSLAFSLLAGGTAHADNQVGPVTWQSKAGANEYWNLQGYSTSNGGALIAYPWTNGSNEWFYDVLLTDGYRVQETKYSANTGNPECVEDRGYAIDAGIDQWACGDFENNWNVQWAENEPVYKDWELVNQAHDQLATWKYDKYQIFLENRDDSSACDSNSGLNEICAQVWQ